MPFQWVTESRQISADLWRFPERPVYRALRSEHREHNCLGPRTKAISGFEPPPSEAKSVTPSGAVRHS